jgi:phosphohistidine phosphatase
MKRLILTRHAKSSWSNSELRDFDRPLNERGRLSAPFMAKKLLERQLIPDAIVTSPAIRAWQTTLGFEQGFGRDMEIISNERIYEARKQELMLVVNTLPEKFYTVMLVGHNPGMSDFVDYLTGTTLELVTCAQVCIRFDVSQWSEIGPDSGILEWHDYPRNYPEMDI